MTVITTYPPRADQNLSGYALLSGASFSGAISATNLSGANTGDQDLSGYALLSGASFTGAISATNLSGTNTGDVVVLYDTHANIVDTASPSEGDTAYSTDYNQNYLYTDGEWRVDAVPTYIAAASNPNIGYDQFPMVSGYSENYILEKNIAYCTMIAPIIAAVTTDVENALTTDDEGFLYKIDASGVAQAIPTGFRLRVNADNDQIEYNPTGSIYWIEVHTGNSVELGANGYPYVHNYTKDIGAYPAVNELNGGTF